MKMNVHIQTLYSIMYQIIFQITFCQSQKELLGHMWPRSHRLQTSVFRDVMLHSAALHKYVLPGFALHNLMLPSYITLCYIYISVMLHYTTLLYIHLVYKYLDLITLRTFLYSIWCSS